MHRRGEDGRAERTMDGTRGRGYEGRRERMESKRKERGGEREVRRGEEGVRRGEERKGDERRRADSVADAADR